MVEALHAALAALVPQMNPYFEDRAPRPVYKLKPQPLTGPASAAPR
jgi:hypothetical protein